MRTVLQVKIVTFRIWVIYRWQKVLFLSECLMRWYSFLTRSYRLVSNLEQYTTIKDIPQGAINCYEIDNVFSFKERNNYNPDVINLHWNIFNILTFCIKLFSSLFIYFWGNIKSSLTYCQITGSVKGIKLTTFQ